MAGFGINKNTAISESIICKTQNMLPSLKEYEKCHFAKYSNAICKDLLYFHIFLTI